MALPSPDRRIFTPSMPAGERHLTLVPNPEINLFKDPERQFFYDAAKLFTRKSGIKLLLAIPPKGEIIGSKLAEEIFGQNMPAKPRSKLKELIDAGLSDYIAEGTIQNNQKTYSLTEQGETLYKAAQIIRDFFGKGLISSSTFGDNTGDGISSSIIRSEMIFSFALNGDKGYKQAELAKELKNSTSTMCKAFSSLEKAGVIIIDNHVGHLTPLGETVIKNLLLPIAEITGYPKERILEIKKALWKSEAPLTLAKLNQEAKTALGESERRQAKGQILTNVQEQALLIAARAEMDAKELWENYPDIFSRQPLNIVAMKAFAENIQDGKSTQAVLQHIYRQSLLGTALNIAAKEMYGMGSLSELAEDLLQDILEPKKFSRILQHYNPDKGRLESYVVSALTNRAKDLARQFGVFEQQYFTDSNTPSIEAFLADTHPSNNPANIAIQREREETVRKAISQLPSNYQDAIIAFYFQGLACAEIAGRLHLSEPAVKMLLFRARQRLKSILSPYMETTAKVATRR